MTPNTMRDVLGKCREHLCQQLQTQRVRELIASIDAALAESEPDHIAEIAPRRLAPGETPREKGFYWATHKYTGDVTLIDARGIVFTCLSDFTDFYGPLTDPREEKP